MPCTDRYWSSLPTLAGGGTILGAAPVGQGVRCGAGLVADLQVGGRRHIGVRAGDVTANSMLADTWSGC